MSPTSRGSPLAATVRRAPVNDAGLVSVITVDASEPVLAGHFPGFPIVPGVCLIEFVQQSFLLALPDLDLRPVLTRLEKVRFLRPVFPGETISVRIEVSTNDGSWLCKAKVEKDGAPVAVMTLCYGTHRPAALPLPAPGPLPTRPRLDLPAIKGLLPHRYPILLIDRVMGIDAHRLVAIKSITANEPCYARMAQTGGDYAYPEALLVESWCQAAALLVCHTDPSPDATTGKATLFGAVANLAFAGRPQPGDVLVHQVRAVAVRADAAIVEGETLVDGRPVMAVGQIVIALRPAAELVKA